MQWIGDELSSKGIAALFRAADAYVTAEAFQMPLAQAMAAGLPVVAPAGGAAEEVVHPKVPLVPSLLVRQNSLDGHLIVVDDRQLADALEATFHNTSSSAGPTPTVAKLWARRWLSISHAADMVLAEVALRNVDAGS